MKTKITSHKWLFMLFFIVFGLANASYAEAAEPAAGSTSLASTGTLVAAALESAGYRAQAMVLTDLAKMLNSLGVLLYVGCAISAIITVALGGKYSMGLWFIMGPALFSFIIKTTDSGNGVEWQFGDNYHDNYNVEELLSTSSGETNVSWVFHRYNVLVSSIVQNLISVVSKQDVEDEMIFTVRQQMYRDVFAANIGSSDLSALVHYGQSVCAREMSNARQLALGERDPNYKNTAEYRVAKNLYDQSWAIENKGIEATSPMGRYIMALSKKINSDAFRKVEGIELNMPLAAYEEAVNEAFPNSADRTALQNGTFNPEVRKVTAPDGTTKEEGRSFSCQQIWVLMGLGVYGEALSYMKDSQSKHAPNADGELLKKLHNDLATKLTKEEDLSVPRDPYEEGSENTTDPVDPDPSIIPVVMGGYMLRKSMADAPLNGFIGQVAQKAGIEVSPNNFSTSGKRRMSDNERAQFSGFSLNYLVSEQKKHELFVYAMSIPYLQGVILYVLGLTFPFFALMVILPGKASAFYNWMALWAWAKSWDVGYALVMVIDKVLWEMLPHSAIYDQVKDPKHSPITMMEAAFQGDPSYAMSGYYSIMTLLMVSVPIMMAKLILGAKAGGIASLMSLFKGIGSSAGVTGSALAKNAQGQRATSIRDIWTAKQARIFSECAMGQRDMKELPTFLAPIMKNTLDSLEGAKDNNAQTAQTFKSIRNYTAGSAIATAALSYHPALSKIKPAMEILKLAQIGTAVTSDRAYQDLTKRGIAIQGQINNAMVEFGAYQAIQTEAMQQFEINRAASNLRGENTNFMEFPTDTVYNSYLMAEQNKANVTERKANVAAESMALGIAKGIGQ